MKEDARIVSPQNQPEDEQIGNNPVNLRPNTLADFVGQREVCDNLKVFITAAKQRGEALDHVLLFGPPGLGKTTLSSIVAKELGVGFHATSAPLISKSGDLAAILIIAVILFGVVAVRDFLGGLFSFFIAIVII